VACTGTTAERDSERDGEPHTCRPSQVKGVHAQLTGSYIRRCILSVVRENSDVTASSLIESILLFAGYRVKYSKAWRAKQHAIALLWGDWKVICKNSKGLESHEPLQSWG
jgi:hypothetical protein